MSKNLRIRPLAGYALVKPEDSEERTASGLYLPDNAQERPARGTVVAVGPALKQTDHAEKAQFSVGETVIYKKWGGDELKIDGQDYKLVKFEDVMAVVD